ncbi:MAG: hypothetical protein ACODAJ_11755 [Planctomycetota bacterium]
MSRASGLSVFIVPSPVVAARVGSLSTEVSWIAKAHGRSENRWAVRSWRGFQIRTGLTRGFPRKR